MSVFFYNFVPDFWQNFVKLCRIHAEIYPKRCLPLKTKFSYQPMVLSWTIQQCTYWYICTILVAIYLQFLHTQLIPPLQNRMHPPLPLFASATSPSTPPKHHSDDSIHLLEPISRNSSQPTKVQNPASNLAQACRSSFSLGRPCCVTVQIHASQRTTNK